jgi:hypothetical protein
VKLIDIGYFNKFSLCILIFFVSVNSYGETITCGLKTVTVEENVIIKIIHEDGTIHTGGSVSNNWTYDGESIKHRLIDEAIPCGSKPKSRNDVISDLSGKFTTKPDLYGMNKQEAELMRDYTANLMRKDNECHLLVDAAKSASRKDMFYIDCNNKSSNIKRYWISKSELNKGVVKNITSPVSNSLAIEVCSNELKKNTKNPSTYNPSLLMGTASQAIEKTGRNIIEIKFEAANELGVLGKYVGHCILEAGTPIEVKIKDL